MSAATSTLPGAAMPGPVCLECDGYGYNDRGSYFPTYSTERECPVCKGSGAAGRDGVERWLVHCAEGYLDSRMSLAELKRAVDHLVALDAKGLR